MNHDLIGEVLALWRALRHWRLGLLALFLCLLYECLLCLFALREWPMSLMHALSIQILPDRRLRSVLRFTTLPVQPERTAFLYVFV